MANFLIVVDPDPARRTAFCAAAGPSVSCLDGLVAGHCETADFAAMWATGIQAPVTSWSDDSDAVIVWGRALADDDTAVDAATLAERWRDVANAMPSAFDGYHVAVTYGSRRGVVIGADILGLFPVFWWSDEQVLLVGSSPELFRLHPSFRWRLDPEGLTGMLLMSHSVGDRTLMQGVKRLAYGHLLTWSPGSRPRERRQFTLPATTDHFDLPFSKARDLLCETLSRAVDRHVPRGSELALALSGGRDSRLLAGMVDRLGRQSAAVTFGSDGDLEMQCAKGVADALGMKHHGFPIPHDPNDIQARLHAKWLHCTTGFNSINYWNSHHHLQGVAPYLVTGYFMDGIVGGTYMDWFTWSDAARPGFDGYFAKINGFGIRANILGRLLRRDVLGEPVDAIIDEIRQRFESGSTLVSHQAWRFHIGERVRTHLCNAPWTLSFGAWPIMPAIDKAVLTVVGGLPIGILAERRAEDEMIRERFPALAELPLDRNGFDTSPISPRLRDRIGTALRARAAPLLDRLPRRREDPTERRIYFRLYDFNSPAWQTARQQAEPHREKLYAIFDRTVLNEILPPAGTSVPFADGIKDATSRKMLVGLCLWAGEYL